MDIAQEGFIGLDRAIDLFNPSFGFAFSTYATKCIQDSIQRSFGKCNPDTALPAHVSKRKKVIIAMAEADKSVIEISEAVNLSKELVVGVLSFRNTKSKDSPLSNRSSEGTSFGDFITDPNSVRAFENVDLKLLFAEFIDRLSEREREVIAMRFGLFGYEERPMVEIAELFGVSRQAVNNNYARAIDKLRKWCSIN